MWARFIPLIVFLLTVSCTEPPNHLVGTWQAIHVSEQGDSMLLSPSEVSFRFLENGRYQYNSTLLYKEAGTYRVQDEFLVARDTTRAGSTDKIVAIELLNADSLQLKMREGDAERQLLFLKN